MSIRYNIRNLQTFESVSRHGSVSKAAEELGVSQSAISHQIRNLTEEIGERLIIKSGRGISLTSAGEKLAATLQAAFSEIQSSVRNTVGGGRKTVRLAVCTCFAPGWLVGRLKSFFAVNPSFDLQIRLHAKDPETTDSVADAFITMLPQEAGFSSMLLMKEKLIALYAPSALNGSARPEQLPLITTDLPPGRFGRKWHMFAERAGWPPALLDDATWLQCTHSVVALEMALHGLGIALIPDFLGEKYVADGSLVQLGSTEVPTGDDYYFCTKISREDEPALKLLTDWFRTQVQ